MNQLTLSFLGAFEARLGEKPLINFRSAKAQGLLIYLALNRQQAHERDVLAALFWPDEPESVASQNLRQSLYRLRLLLGETAQEEPLPQAKERQHLLVTRTTVQFNATSNYTLDVATYLSHLAANQLEQAVALYRGDLLPGFTCDSLPFDEWLRQEREELHRLALAALFEITADCLTRGDAQKAQRLARQQLVLEPWREEAHRQLMQALALAGDRSAALAQYETCRRVLIEELGIEPAAETRTLVARIRDQQLDQQALHKSDGSHEPRRLITPFVGRHREYGLMVNAYRQVSRNTLQVVALVGNAGIGKTRLAQQFLAWAATEGADVLNGRCFETSSGLSYQPLTHLLRQRIERENAPEDLLSDLWLSQLTRLLPELHERYPDLPPPTQEENTARQHLFEAITRLGQALAARQPLVLLIDDWHWADSASLDVLHYAVQQWTGATAPILVLLTLRQESLTESPDLQSWLNQLRRTVSAVQLNLGELSQAETEQLVQMILAPEAGSDHVTPTDSTTPSALPKFSQWLFEETDGQPLLLAETLKALVEDGLIQPNTAGTSWHINQSKLDEQADREHIFHGVYEIIQGWLTRITAVASDLLMAAAVLAQAASFDNLCRVSGLDERQAVTALEELLKRQLLIEPPALQPWEPDPVYTFSHQKVSEVVYAEVGTARRRMLHRRAFEILQAMAVPSVELAHHALAAGLPAETIRYSLMAGNDALALFAVRVALPHYETAWRITEQQGWPETISGADKELLYSSLGRAYELTEEWTKAEEIYKAMISYAESINAPAMECLGLNQLSAVYYLKFDKADQAVALLERAKKLAEQNGDERWRAETELNLAMVAYENQDHALTLHHAEQALDIARKLDHPQLMARHLSILSYVYLQQCKWDKVETFAAEASRFYTGSGNLVLAADTDRVVGFAQILSGKPQEALATLEKTAAYSHHIENLWGETECTWKLAMTHLELGHYSIAIQLAENSIKMARQLGLPSMLALALIAGSQVRRQTMSLAAAQEFLLETIAVSKEHRLYAVIWDWAMTELCAVYASAGSWEQAADYARQRSQARGNEALLSMSLSGWYETEALLRGGDGDLARAEVERLAEIVGNNRRYHLVLLRSQAVLAQGDGDVDQAITHLQAALALAQAMELPGEEWPILGELGKLYAEQGEMAQAREAYREAANLIHRLAETIDEDGLRVVFLTAVSVRSVLEGYEVTK